MNLHPSLDSPALQAGLERFAAAKAFHARAHVDLEAAQAELQAAVTASDSARAAQASRSVLEAQIVADAVPAPTLDTDARSAMSHAVARLQSRWPEVEGYRRGAFVAERTVLGRRYASWSRFWLAWQPTGEPPEQGLALLAQASELATAFDEFFAVMPSEPARPDALQRAGVRAR